MMCSIRYWIIFLVAFLISCNQDKQLNECNGHSTVFIHSTINTDLKEAIDKKFSNKKIEVVSDVLEIIHIIEEVSDTLIIKSGGIAPNTNSLLNGCIKGNYALKVFDEINERLKNKVTALKEKYSASKDEETIQMIDYLLNNYFYGRNPFFNKEHIAETSFSNLSLDLLLIQNALYVLLMNKY